METQKTGKEKPSPFNRLFALSSKRGFPLSVLFRRARHLYSQRRSNMSLGPWCPISSHLFALFLGSISVSPYEKSRITKIKGIASSLPPQISISKTVKMGRSKVQLKKGNCLVTRQAIILDRADSSDPILHFLWKTTHLDMMRLLHKKKNYELVAIDTKKNLRICQDDKKQDQDIFYGMDKY